MQSNARNLLAIVRYPSLLGYRERGANKRMASHRWPYMLRYARPLLFDDLP